MSNMNDNAPLYGLGSYYDANSSPYQCMAIPWWVQTPHPTYFPRHGCKIEPLICGERVFGHISRDIKKAKQTVDIITWGFDPGMVLVRGAAGEVGQRYGELLEEIATRKDNPVIVRLLVWHDDVMSMKLMKNIPGYYGLRHPSVGSAEGGYYSESHQNYNANWFEKICRGDIPNIIFHVRSVPSSLLNQSLSGEPPVPIGVKGALAELYAAHHQKMVLIDYEVPAKAVGYVMGHNSITDFWDSDKHVFRDPRRETFYKADPARAWDQGPSLDPAGGLYVPGYQPSQNDLDAKARAVQTYLDRNSYVTKPYQDVSSRLQGPILCDVNHNFCEAWKESERPSSHFMDCYWLVQGFSSRLSRTPNMFRGVLSDVSDLVHSELDSKFIERRKKILSNTFSLPGEDHSVQLLRTQPLHGEKAIKECYANLTRQIHHYIFIQNQYIQYDSWADHLKECVQRLRTTGYQEQIYVFMLTSTPERDGMDLPTYSVVSKLGTSETMAVEHTEAVAKAKEGKGKMPVSVKEMQDMGINVVMGSLWTCAEKPAKETDYEEIYIHAKVAVVDDAAFTLGSANLNLRSMAIDSELNILSQAKDVAYQLRSDLFAQCTGEMGPPQFWNMGSTFNKWKTTMLDNSGHKQKIEPLKSQLLPFHVDRPYGSPVV
jgi:phosphatidylserine/phosphatidylglycerophosphate/cardiolipin synthase-like enzyme